jgi:hypothetical protein
MDMTTAHRLRIVVRARHKRPERTVDAWRDYERRKQEIADTAMSAAEYEQRIRELAEEIGV